MTWQPERGPAVPKFGEWDENNPASADGFTHIFNKVREEKQTGAAKVPAMPTESSYNNDHRKDSSDDFGPVVCMIHSSTLLHCCLALVVNPLVVHW